MPNREVSIPVETVEPNALYLRSNLVSGEDGEGLTFDLDLSGASLILTVRLRDGSTVKQTMTLTTIATAWVNAVEISA